MSAPVAGVLRGQVAKVRALGGGWLQNLCLGLLVLFVVVSVFAPWLAPQDPTYGELGAGLVGPSTDHWLGTDQGGHDTFSALIEGSRTSLVGPMLVVLFSTVTGIAVGLFSAWRGGWIDTVIGRLLDVIFAFPALLVAILAVAVFGKGMTAPVIAMSVAYMPYTARLVRGLALQEQARPYIAAYRVQGHSRCTSRSAGCSPTSARPCSPSPPSTSATRCSTSPRCPSSASASSHRPPTGEP